MMRVARALVGVMLLLMASGWAVYAEDVSPKDQALFDAIENKDIGGVQAALKQGANVNAITSDGCPALYMATRHGETDILKLLLDKHANVNAAGGSLVCYGTSLNTAAFHGNIDIARILLDHHADVNLRDPHQGAPMLDAAASGHIEMCEFLLAHHADVEATQGIGGETALDVAANNSMDGMRWLLAHHANTESRDAEGQTPLMHAVDLKFETTPEEVVEKVKLLLAYHASLEARDNDGKTALMVAASHSWPEVVKVLLEAHADVSATAKDGKTAFDLAANNMRCENVLALEQGGRSHTMTCLSAVASAIESPERYSQSRDMWMPEYDELFKIAVNTRLAMTPLPTEVPQEARAAYVQGNTMFKASQSDDDAKKAIGMYREAVILAPWFVDAWGNMEVVQEKIGDYKGAAESVGYLVKVEPDGAHDQAKLDHMYALQAKAKLAAQ